MTTAGEPSTIAELSRAVAVGDLCVDVAIGRAYALGFRDAVLQKADDESPRVVRVGNETHSPEAKT